jgi:hypothetical protein
MIDLNIIRVRAREEIRIPIIVHEHALVAVRPRIGREREGRAVHGETTAGGGGLEGLDVAVDLAPDLSTQTPT